MSRSKFCSDFSQPAHGAPVQVRGQAMPALNGDANEHWFLPASCSLSLRETLGGWENNGEQELSAASSPSAM